MSNTDYKNFSQLYFRRELQQCLMKYDMYELSNDDFVRIFIDIIDRHAPLKQKYVRSNQVAFMTKDLRKYSAQTTQ